MENKNGVNLKVFVSGLAEYNNGELTGDWIDLLSDGGFEKLAEFTKEFGEWFISDYESELFYIGEYESVEELKEMADTIKNHAQQLTADQGKAIGEFYSEYERHTLIDDLENDRFIMFDCEYYGYCEYKALGSWYATNSLIPHLDEMIENSKDYAEREAFMTIRNNIDHESLGLEIRHEGFSYVDTTRYDIETDTNAVHIFITY